MTSRPHRAYGLIPRIRIASNLLLVILVGVLSLVPLAFNKNFYFYADTAEGAYGQWFELGQQLLGGQWPLMNPAAWMAGNYAAEGQWGLWNPIVLITAIIVSQASSAVFVSSVVKIFFLIVGSLGVYHVARSYGIRNRWAFVAGFAAPFAGFTLFMDATSWVTNEMVWAFSAWAIWAIREFLAGRRSILWPAVTGYLLITVGYVEGTVILVLFYMALIIDAAARRKWHLLGKILLIGMIHGLFTVTVYLPGVLTSSVTTRANEVANSGFMVLNITGLLTSSTGFTTGPLAGWWGPFENLPLLYIAWFLPLLFLISLKAIPLVAKRLSTLLIFGFLVLMLATGPSDLGPLRFPARSLPWIAMVLIIVTTLVLDRGTERHLGGVRLVLMFASVTFSAWLVFSSTPQNWHWPRNAFHLAVYAGGIFVTWFLLRHPTAFRTRLTPNFRRNLVPILIVAICAVVTVLQSKSFAPLVQSRSDYPDSASVYESALSFGHGDGIIIGDPLSLPQSAWGETVFGNSWYLAKPKVQNVYTPVGYETYSQDLCLLYDGRSCPALLDKLFSTDPTTGMRMVDLFSTDTVQILESEQLPMSQLRTRVPPSGWHLADVGQQSVTWVRDGGGSTVGEAVWSSDGVHISQGRNTNLGSTVHIDSVGPEGGTIVFSRLAWPGYRVQGADLATATRGYLLTVHVPSNSAGRDVTVTFRPPGWILEVSTFLLAWLLTFALATYRPLTRHLRMLHRVAPVRE